MPLYLQRVFAAKYQMVTLIPVVFGAGKWIASLPTGYLLDRVGRRRMMACGLLVIACCDVASVMTSVYGVFLCVRALAGLGWAMFGTVALTTVVDARAAARRGRSVSLLLTSETLGLLFGSAAGGWLYQSIGIASPFFFEAACMIVASIAIACSTFPGAVLASSSTPGSTRDKRAVVAALRIPGVLLMGVVSAVLIAVQTGVIVFLVPLYFVNRGHASPETVGVLVSLAVLGRLVALWIGGGVSDRVGRLRVLIPGLLAYAALLGVITLLTDVVALGCWSLAIGAAAGIVLTLPTALVGDRAPSHLHGVAIGWLRTLTDTGQILGPLVMGALADRIDLSSPFLVGAALLTLTALACRARANAISPARAPKIA
jgi:MFS family permease